MPNRPIRLDVRADMQALTKRVLSFAKADQTRVVVRSTATGQSRFVSACMSARTSSRIGRFGIVVISRRGRC